jgi:hypothetical protein
MGMNPRIKNMVGEVFGLLTVQYFIEVSEKGNTTIWMCKCRCGNTRKASRSNLRTGHARSCGCMEAKHRVEGATKHGMFGTPEYHTWGSMIQRVTNPKNNRYADYGGRGITVCWRWMSSFDNFYEDMGKKPKGTTLGRIDNDGKYCKDNCEWQTAIEQANNKRNNRMFTYQGRTQSVCAWAGELGLDSQMVGQKIRRGESIRRALRLPWEL